MPENNVPTQDSTPSRVSSIRSSKLFVVTTVALGLLSGVLGILLALEKQNAAGIVQRAAKQSSQVQTKPTQDPASVNNGTQEEVETVMKTSYSAEVGKFTLSLPADYYIIREQDGGGEGGPLTRVAVGKKHDQGVSVVDASSHQKVSVSAYPMENRGSFRDQVNNELYQDNYKQLDSVPMPGASSTAEVYEIYGIGDARAYFFEEAGIFYVIDVATWMPETQEVVEDVIAGLTVK